MTYDEIVLMLKGSADGCCMGDQWRGRTCPYHSGYVDGLSDMQAAMQAEIDQLNADIETLRAQTVWADEDSEAR